MKYEETKYNDYLVIHLQGEVDLSCSPQARAQILKALKVHNKLLIDLSKVDYIDSSGIASLVEGYQTARSQSIDFALLGVSKAALQVLTLSRLDKIFVIYDTLEDCK